MFKRFVQKKLEKFVKKYFEAHPDVKLICVAGSVGKSSTKMAIAHILKSQYRVRVEEQNHNTEMSAPLAILGIPYPSDIKSVLAWLKVFKQAKLKIKQPKDVDVIIQELGVDRPGDMAVFARYLKPDLSVVTSITPEHMEFFGTMENVAKEELAIAGFSKVFLINRDDVDIRYASLVQNQMTGTYGTSEQAEYRFIIDQISVSGMTGRLRGREFSGKNIIKTKMIGEHSARVIAGAAAVCARFGISEQNIAAGIASFRPVSGRMNILEGTKGSFLIDDSYNSSPNAAKMALDTLYKIKAPKKIAILGSMNELGQMSPDAHSYIGSLCRKDQLDWVVTVGEEANRFLAPAARNNGIYVKEVANAIDAGGFVSGQLIPGTLVLIKGSQGGIYLEEATKILLRHQNDDRKLVRQSPTWMETKSKFFSNIR